jgi:protein-disulfide isomerase/uncharacterized membrane protein
MQRSQTRRFVLGILLLGVAAGASLLLVLEHLGALSLPGCGQGSPCAQATASAWGRVPLLNWPTAFVGFAYFVAALAAWILARGRVAGLLRMIVRLGALASAGFTLVLFIQGHICNYCLTTHLANFAFLFVVERIGAWDARRPAPLLPFATLVFVFLAVSTGLAVILAREKASVGVRQESERAASTAAIIAAIPGSRDQAGEARGDSLATGAPGPPAGAPAEGQTAAASNGQTPAAPDTLATSPEARAAGLPGGAATASSDATGPTAPWSGPFTGRYRRGPERAAVRIVVYTDYQCRDCARVEKDIEGLLARHTNVSFSVKQFPMCSDCNPQVERNLHPNACWAARAAEAAGILKGTEGFLQMHDWLFSVNGGFDRDGFRAKLLEFGYDVETFVATMRGERTLALVQADIAEGLWLGLHYTPMVFVNGIEMKGIFAPSAIVRTVEEVLAHNPPPSTADHDRPPPALEKYVDDWRQQPRRSLPADQSSWVLGPADAAVTVVVWGDYQEPGTAKADSIFQDQVAKRRDVRYVFRHFPVNRSCNPVPERDLHPQACLAARAAETAGQLGGQRAYWAMHAWLLDHRDAVSEEAVLSQAAALGLDRAAFAQTSASAAVEAAIQEDCQGAKQVGMTAVPTVYVNGRFVPRLRLPGADPMSLILNAAAAEARGGGPGTTP